MKINIEGVIILVLLVLMLIVANKPEKTVLVYPNISKPVIIDFGGCTNGTCVLLVYNNGTKTVRCNQISVYADKKFYGTLNNFKDPYGQRCDYIQPKKYVRLVTPDLCAGGTEKVIIESNFTDSIVPDNHLYSMYISSFLCATLQYNKTSI